MSYYVIVRKSPSTGRELYLTESRSAGISFEAPGHSATGVGISNLKTWKTWNGAQKWLEARPGFVESYAKAGLEIDVKLVES